jgi:cell division protease FtsH
LVTKDDERYLQTEPELQNRMEMLLAGRNAELLILGCASTGASDDLKHASSIALRMVCEFGFGRAHGPFSFAGLPEGDAFTDARQRALAEAQDVLKAADERCQARLTARRDALSKLTRALLESETVSGQVVKDCLGHGPISLAA